MESAVNLQQSSCHIFRCTLNNYVTTRGSAVLSKSTAAPTKGWTGAGLAPSKSAPQCSRNVFQNSKKRVTDMSENVIKVSE